MGGAGVEIKPKIGKAKNIKIENDEKTKDMIQGGHGKKVSWSDVVRIKDKVPNTILNGHSGSFSSAKCFGIKVNSN